MSADEQVRANLGSATVNIERRFAAHEAELAKLRVRVADLEPLKDEVRHLEDQIHALEKRAR